MRRWYKPQSFTISRYESGWQCVVVYDILANVNGQRGPGTKWTEGSATIYVRYRFLIVFRANRAARKKARAERG